MVFLHSHQPGLWQASSEGYLPHSGPPLDVRDLLRAYEMEGIRTGVGMYVQQEEDRCRTLAAASSTLSTAATMVLTDPLDRLAEKDITNVTVDDLISALHVTPEEVKLLETMTAGQRHNPLWIDAMEGDCEQFWQSVQSPQRARVLLLDYIARDNDSRTAAQPLVDRCYGG